MGSLFINKILFSNVGHYNQNAFVWNKSNTNDI